MVPDMAKNCSILPSQVFGPIMTDIARLAGIVQSGRALAYSMANLDAEFRTRFRGWGYNAHTWFTDYRDWSQTSLDTTLGTLRAAGLQGQQLAKRTGCPGPVAGHGAIPRRAHAGSSGREPDRRAAGSADHEAPPVDAGGPSKQAGLSGGADSTADGDGSGIREILHFWRPCRGWQGLPSWSMM